jgi:lipid A 3-O-deacylase
MCGGPLRRALAGNMLVLSGLLLPVAATRAEAITATVENDVLTGSDNSYSNGFGIAWVSDAVERYDDAHPVSRWSRLLDGLQLLGDPGYSRYVAWSLTQEIHTPDDITLVDPPADDQPYAGVLTLDSVLYARSARWSHALELKLGVVGPASRAEQVQREFHALIGADEPMGWRTQLPDEPVINLGLTSAYLWREGHVGETARWRVLPIGHLGVGNYYTGVGLGLYGEVGWNLVDAFGGNALREGFSAASMVGAAPSEAWSLSLFGGLGGHARAHYLPLDGTVFHSSRSVDTEPVIGNATLGTSLRRGRFAVSLAVTVSSKAYAGQSKAAEFGTLSIAWHR